MGRRWSITKMAVHGCAQPKGDEPEGNLEVILLSGYAGRISENMSRLAVTFSSSVSGRKVPFW